MSKYIFSALVIFIFLCGCSVVSGSEHEHEKNEKLKEQQKEFNKEEAINMLSEFYKGYIDLVSNSLDENEIYDFKTKYCKAELLINIRSQELDHDPFLKAQDANEEWLKTLKIHHEEGHIFSITYLNEFLNETIDIKVKVNKSGKRYIITDIID